MPLSDSERHILQTLRNVQLEEVSLDAAIAGVKELSTEGQFYVPWLVMWDDDWAEDLLLWILGSDRCDAATAMAMYWLNQSWDWLAVPDKSNPKVYEIQGYKMAVHIQDRMATYSFPSTRFS